MNYPVFQEPTLPHRISEPTIFEVQDDLFAHEDREYIAAVLGVMVTSPEHRFIITASQAQVRAWLDWANSDGALNDGALGGDLITYACDAFHSIPLLGAILGLNQNWPFEHIEVVEKS